MKLFTVEESVGNPPSLAAAVTAVQSRPKSHTFTLIYPCLSPSQDGDIINRGKVYHYSPVFRANIYLLSWTDHLVFILGPQMLLWRRTKVIVKIILSILVKAQEQQLQFRGCKFRDVL